MFERTNPGDSFASLFEQSRDAKSGSRKYHTGERVEVTVVAITRDSVFADLGGKQEGMFERTDLLDDKGVLNLEVGARIVAQVGAVDRETGEVRLVPVSVRQQGGGGAGQQAAQAPLIVEGSRAKGKVTGVERYGVFVQLAGTSGRTGRGLVPAQETGAPRGADLRKLFPLGAEIEVKVLKVEEDGKIRLSVAALKADDERKEFESFADKGAKAAGTGKKPEPRGFGTLGDLLKKR